MLQHIRKEKMKWLNKFAKIITNKWFRAACQVLVVVALAFVG
jgi:hypothetical protein